MTNHSAVIYEIVTHTEAIFYQTLALTITYLVFLLILFILSMGGDSCSNKAKYIWTGLSMILTFIQLVAIVSLYIVVYVDIRIIDQEKI